MIIAFHGNNLFASYLVLAARRAGHQVVVADSCPALCDLAFVAGGRQGDLIAAYDVPVFVFDWGYVRRVNNHKEIQKGHWQVSHGQLNTLPFFTCPGDRFDALGLGIQPSKNGGDYVLLLGQRPDDAAVLGTDHAAWLRDQASIYVDAGYPVKYREHPRGGVKLSGVDTLEGSLADALSGADFVVTYNSNAGHEALLAGVPVVCDPCAPYAYLSGTNCPSKRERLAYFNLAAYGQWRIDEAPQCIDFVINRWLPKLAEANA